MNKIRRKYLHFEKENVTTSFSEFQNSRHVVVSKEGPLGSLRFEIWNTTICNMFDIYLASSIYLSKKGRETSGIQLVLFHGKVPLSKVATKNSDMAMVRQLFVARNYFDWIILPWDGRGKYFKKHYVSFKISILHSFFQWFSKSKLSRLV